MTRIIKLLAALLLLAVAAPGIALAQAPIAGSGELPGVDPLARPSRAVVDAIEKIMSDRGDRGPFLLIRSCFVESGAQPSLLQICRQRLERYYREMMTEGREALAALPPMEIFVRLVELAKDPDAAGVMSDMFALRGILKNVEELQTFREIKDCYREAGPQPAIRQICRQRLDRFHIELTRTKSDAMRDVKPEVIHHRLLELADADRVGVAGGDMTAFESLRNIRKVQQDELARRSQSIALAAQNYCSAPPARQSPPIEVRMSDPGVCLCGYGRRYVGSKADLSGHPVRAIYGQCGPDGRFRIADLNGGSLMHGDWITIQAAHGGYVTVTATGAVLADRPEVGKYERFRIFRANGVAGRIQAGEMVGLISPRGVYVTTNVEHGGSLRGTREKLKPHEYFVLVPN